MTRESKNNNDGAVFTYHEFQKMDHGTTHLRLPAAALKPWHHCALRLSITHSPVITPQGVLYDREAILLNLLQQKQQIRQRRIKQQADRNRQQREVTRQLDDRRREEDAKFVKVQETVHLQDNAGEDHSVEPGRDNLTSNFWLPASDQAVDNSISQPAKRRKKDTLPTRTVCPITGNPLKSRDLIILKPCQLDKQNVSHVSDDDDDTIPVESNLDVIYICPVCQTALVNSAKPVALRTGTVICKRCADDFVKKDGCDPITATQLDLKSDIIEIQNSGTAFAASSSDNPASKEAKLYRPSVR